MGCLRVGGREGLLGESMLTTGWAAQREDGGAAESRREQAGPRGVGCWAGAGWTTRVGCSAGAGWTTRVGCSAGAGWATRVGCLACGTRGCEAWAWLGNTLGSRLGLE